MKKFARIFLCWFLIILPAVELLSLDKDKVFENLKAKYSSANSLKISFSLRNSSLQGTLAIQQPNLFRLVLNYDNLPEKIIVCDGKTLWNYSPRNNNVIISNILEEDSPSLQNFFTTILTNYTAHSLAKEINSALGSSLLLTLKSAEAPSQLVRIYLDNKFSIKAIDLDNDDSTSFYIIKKIHFNPKFPKNYFHFLPPKGTEVFDYR
ncbi:MAG: LolA family protein [Candidatus Kapaibacteriota bacterium]